MARNVVITGSTSGIGLGIAAGFAKAGDNIMLNGFGSEDAINDAVTHIGSLGSGSVAYHGADMTKPDEIADMIAKAEYTFGGIDVLVNNAGIQHVSPVEDFPPEKWDAIIAINLTSSFHTIRHTVPVMKKQGSGRIINLVSAHGLVASPFKSAYVTAKHGMMGLTKTVALELAQDHITVNAICPGYVLTPLVEKQIPDTAKARGMTEDEVKSEVLLAAQPTKAFVTVEQIAETALYLASDAASQITGTHISIDGGWTAQ